MSQAKQKWQAQGIENYRLVLKFYENFLNGRKSQREVIVKQGRMVASSCTNNLCPGFVLTDVHTVDDLFMLTQGTSLKPVFLKEGEPLEKCVTLLAFDTTYGFPETIKLDCPYAYDEDHSVEVVSFEVLKGDNGDK